MGNDKVQDSGAEAEGLQQQKSTLRLCMRPEQQDTAPCRNYHDIKHGFQAHAQDNARTPALTGSTAAAGSPSQSRSLEQDEQAKLSRQWSKEWTCGKALRLQQ